MGGKTQGRAAGNTAGRAQHESSKASASVPEQRCTSTDPRPEKIGVISDTHGYLHPAIVGVFAGVSHIIHAGDIMDGATLTALQAVAPVTAVAGNLDTGELADSLPKEVLGQEAGISFAVGHKRKRLLKRLATGKLRHAEGTEPRLVVFGHEHAPSASWVDGVLYLNPGTATAPDEEDDAATVAIVQADAAGLNVTFVPLPRGPVPESDA